MNVIVTAATTIVITLFVIERTVPLMPNSFSAPPSLSASLTLSTMWYLVSRKPSLPFPFVRSSM